MLDVVIAGGGPAGLSAALILGRCRRRVLLCDTGRGRNQVSERVGGFLTRDGTPPLELRQIARAQLQAYSDVTICEAEIIDAIRCPDGFEIITASGMRTTTRKLLLATGVSDDLPPIEGAEQLYGRGVYHCPYCEGWELRDTPLAVYGSGAESRSLALELTVWSRDLVICSDGPAALAPDDRAQLAKLGIAIREESIARLEEEGGRLARIRFANGEALPRRGLFFYSCGQQASDLAERLGCRLTGHGSVDTCRYEETEVPGLYVAGDASRNVQLAIVAAAEGAMAAFAINVELLKEDLKNAARPTDTTPDTHGRQDRLPAGDASALAGSGN